MGFFDVLGGIGGLGGMFDQAPEFVRGLLAQAQQQGQGNPYGALAGLDGQPPMPPQRPMQLDGNNLAQVANPEAPQPPVRPKGLLGMEDAPAPQAQTVQGMGMPGASPQASGNPLSALGDMLGGIYGKGGPGDGLIALGTGLMSKRRIGEGLQAGLDNMQRQQLVQGQSQLQQQKLAQQQSALQGRMSYLKQLNPNMTPEALQATASNDTLFNEVVKRATPSEQYAQEKDDEGNIWSVNKMTGQKTIALKAEADPEQPSSVKEYEYAKRNGFNGSYQDWQTQVGGAGKAPASVQEYEYAKKQGYNGTLEEWLKAKGLKFADFGGEERGALVRYYADREAAGDSSWRTGMNKVPGLLKDVGAELARRRDSGDNSANPTTILQERANQYGRQREQGTLGTATANNTLYGNAAANTIDTAISASREVPRTNWVPVNRLLQMNQSAISDPKLAAFRTALLTTVNDYAKATTPTGTPTDSQRAHAYEVLNTAVGPEGVEAVLRMMHREIANTHRAIELTKTQLQSGKGGHLPELTAEPAGPNVHGSQGVGMWDAVKSVFGGGSNAAPISVKSPDEARKLPPGTAFQTPDGRTFTR